MRGRCQYSHRSEAMSREPPHAAARRRMQRPRRRLRDDRLGRPLSPSRVISGVSRQRISGPCDQHRPTLTTTLRVDVTRLGTRQGGLDEDRSSVPGVRLSLFVSWYSSLGVRLKRKPAAAPPVGRFPLCAWACEEGGGPPRSLPKESRPGFSLFAKTRRIGKNPQGGRPRLDRPPLAPLSQAQRAALLRPSARPVRPRDRHTRRLAGGAQGARLSPPPPAAPRDAC
jgi:hypothetical protein